MGEATFGDAVSHGVDGELFGNAEGDYHGVFYPVNDVDWNDEGETVGDFTAEVVGYHVCVLFC